MLCIFHFHSSQLTNPKIPNSRKYNLFLQRVGSAWTAEPPRHRSGGETAMDITSAMLAVVNHHHHHHHRSSSLSSSSSSYIIDVLINLMNLITIIISIVVIDNMDISLALITTTTIILSNIINWSSICTCAGLYYKMNGQNRPLIKPKRRLVRGIWNYNDDDDADGDGDEDDDNEDDADGEGDSEGVGDISYATHLSGQCLGPRPFFGRLQFIKLDHLPRHFGPHPTYISLLVTALCNTNNNRNKMKRQWILSCPDIIILWKCF